VMSLIASALSPFWRGMINGTATPSSTSTVSRTSRLERSRKQSTRYLAIGGGKAFPADAQARRVFVDRIAKAAGMTAARAEQLLNRYGTTVEAVATFSSEHSDERRLSGATHYSFREIDWIARNELVVHLSDIVLRRTTIAIEGQLTYEGLVDIAGIAAKALGWDAPRVEHEINDVVSLLKAFHGQTLAAGTPDIEPEKSARPVSR